MSERIDMTQIEALSLTPDQRLQAQIDEQKRYIAALEERLNDLEIEAQAAIDARASLDSSLRDEVSRLERAIQSPGR
ncbi:hypothetical protein QWY79_10175 [Halomonas sabkhae]|uniref:hypothetical protein n=1 Tax=Halomonas sabkhae TaxID=626223 RepID=UPI0025B5D500|nr:hypothetical protein [Halomonas sabkhae]MDN3525630.1 hypothetical protein [Halomonas sabkhae]